MKTRFKDIRVWYGRDVLHKRFSAAMLEKEFQDESKPYYCPRLNRTRISKLENGIDNPATALEIYAYCLFFKTTSDYLLGISNIRTINPDMQIAGKITGLSDKSLEILRKSTVKEKRILDALIQVGGLSNLDNMVDTYFALTESDLYMIENGRHIPLTAEVKQAVIDEWLRSRLLYLFERIASEDEIKVLY